MVSSVRDPLAACQAGCPCTEFRLCALAQVSAHITHMQISLGVLLLAALSVILFAVLVVYPAVWSSDRDRRKAGLAVLERIVRWRR